MYLNWIIIWMMNVWMYVCVCVYIYEEKLFILKNYSCSLSNNNVQSNKTTNKLSISQTSSQHNNLNKTQDQFKSHDRSIMFKLNKLNMKAYWIWCQKNKVCFHCRKFLYIVRDCWDNKSKNKNKKKIWAEIKDCWTEFEWFEKLKLFMNIKVFINKLIKISV